MLENQVIHGNSYLLFNMNRPINVKTNNLQLLSIQHHMKIYRKTKN